jgi:hypothetical protein
VEAGLAVERAEGLAELVVALSRQVREQVLNLSLDKETPAAAHFL